MQVQPITTNRSQGGQSLWVIEEPVQAGEPNQPTAYVVMVKSHRQ
jgi:hypothetical protein